MGFLSFNEKYYTDALRRFENRALGKSELYEIKQLLKLLDDLLDEGYTLLKITLEEKYCAISRLKAILKAHGVAPFPARKSVSLNTEYADPEMEIEAVCGKLAEHIKSDSAQTGNPFLADLKKIANGFRIKPIQPMFFYSAMHFCHTSIFFAAG